MKIFLYINGASFACFFDMPYDVILIPKNSFCKAVCACMVIQIKLVVVNIGSINKTKTLHVHHTFL